MAERGTSWLLQGFCGVEPHQIIEFHDVDACLSADEGQVRRQPRRLNITIFNNHIFIRSIRIFISILLSS